MRAVKITDTQELRDIFIEAFLTKTDKVTKVSNNSVLSAVGYGVGKVGQKALVEIAKVESMLFPDTASGNQLDLIASNYGISSRISTTESSVFVRVVGNPGTEYIEGTEFVGNEGITFISEEAVTLGSFGFAYIKARATTGGEETNVAPFTLTEINPTPDGHRYCINEYAAVGGTDVESDELFRARIKDGVNILARGTLASLEQAFIKVNRNVLKVFYQGFDDQSNIKLAIVTRNGVALSSFELGELQALAEEFLSLTDQRLFNQESFRVNLLNINFTAIDINFQVNVGNGVNPDDVRIDAQVAISKYLDFTTFNPNTQLVEWSDLLSIVKNVRGVTYVPDQQFFVNGERRALQIPVNTLPRLRSFIMFDLSGAPIVDLQGNFNPVFYPNTQSDLNFQLTVLRSI